MARLIHGINGSVQGRLGNLVGSSWNGIPYVKTRPKKRTGKPRKAEKANRSKFAMAHRWLQPLLPFVREGYKGYSTTVYGFNAAKSHLLLNAFEGADNNIAINPSLVKVSHGTLPLSDNITVERSGNYALLFTWDTLAVPDGSKSDQVMLLAYDIDNRIAEYNLTGQFRSNGSDTLQLSNKKGRTYHIYFAFTAADRSRQSDSVYLGSITT